MTVDFPLFIRHALCLGIWLGMFCLGTAASRAWARQSVELAWDPSPTDNVAAYNIYFGTNRSIFTDSIIVPDISDVIVPRLEEGKTYYFAVSAVDEDGNESRLSNEISYAVPAPASLAPKLAIPSSEASLAVPAPASLARNPAIAVSGIKALAPSEAPQLVSSPAPMILQTQTFANGDEQSALMEIHTYSVVSGPWEMDSSTNLQNWTPYVSGFGNGNGDGYDVDVYVLLDPTAPKKFFRVVQSRVLTSAPAVTLVPMPIPKVLQTQTFADDNGQPCLMEIYTPSAVAGAWEVESSTDLQNWTPYACGYGNGNGDGCDVDVCVSIDPTAPQMFFRLVQ